MCNMSKWLFAELRQLGPKIFTSLIVIGVGAGAGIVWLFNTLKWPVFLVLAFCLLGIIECGYVAFRREGQKHEGERRWRYRRWRSWALVGLVTFSIVVAGTLTYWLTTGTAVSSSDLADLLARGHAAHDTGLYKEALNFYNQALVISREVGDRAGEGTTLNNIGAVCHGQGQYEQALEYYQAALLIARDLGLSSLEKTVMYNMKDLP